MNKWIVCFTCAALLTVATVASAQITGGVKGGVDLANMSVSSGGATVSPGSRTGFMAGAFLEIPVAKGIAIQPEALITMKGTEYSGILNPLGGSSAAMMKLTYLDFPVLLRVDVPVRIPLVAPYVYAGPNFGVLLSAKGSATGVPEADIKSELKTSDVGLAFGGGVRFRRFLVEARYVRGLTNVFGSAITAEGVTANNNVFKILAGYRF